MAKLPRSPIAQDVRNNYTPVREARASGADPVGQALEGAGNAGFEIASRMADAKIAADAAEASIRLRSRLDEESRAIENDMEGDPASFEARFRERAAAVANEEAGRMSSPAMKRAFAMKSMELTETYSLGMRDTTRRRQVEGVKAQTLKIGADYEALAANPAKPRELLELAKDDYLALIDRQVKAGIYTPDVAEAARIAAGEVYRAGVTTRHLTNVDAMLDAGRYGEAEAYFKASYAEIDPASRAKAEEVLETKKREGEAVTTADKFWQDAAGDYNAFIEKARKIENVDERLAIEARGAVLKNQDEAARAARDDADLRSGMEFITTGRPVPASVLREASPEVRDRLQTEQRTRDMWNQQMATLSAQERAALKEASAVSKDYIKSLKVADPELYVSGTQAWPPEMQADLARLSPTDRSEIEADITTTRGRGGTVDAVDTAFKDLIGQVPMLGPAKMKGKDFDATTKSTGDALTEEKAVRASLYRQAQEYAKRTGGAPLTPQESKVMIARAFREVDPKKYKFEEPGAYKGAITKGILSNPAAIETRAYLAEKLGRAPTDAEVLAMLRAAGEVQ